MILQDVIEKGAEYHGDNAAIIFKGEKITYRELKEDAERISSSLLSLGIGKGDSVAVWMPNNIHYLPI